MKKIASKLLVITAILTTLTSSAYANNLFDFLSSNPSDVSPQAFKMAMTAYNCAVLKGLTHKPIVTIVDFTKPSYKKRLVVYDVANRKVLFSDLVAHGSGSGGTEATQFSNLPRTHASSLGVFLTGNTYFGQHGYSLRLNGLSKGLNDNALSRDIVVHAAAYVSKEFIKLRGGLGRSWGCLAVNPTVSASLINSIKDRTIIFAYYPNAEIERKTPLMQCSA